MNRDTMYDDVMTIEGENDVDERGYYAAIQRQVNAGCWSLQGSHGRAMMDAIENGYVLLGRERARDYYGHDIPSRDDVKEDTKGSYGFVADGMGPAWANYMAAL